MNIAVVDTGTNLTAFIRIDGSWLGSIDVAIDKAFTAKAFDVSTQELGRNSQPGDQFFGIHVSNHDRVMIVAGGIPLTADGRIVMRSASVAAVANRIRPSPKRQLRSAFDILLVGQPQLNVAAAVRAKLPRLCDPGCSRWRCRGMRGQVIVVCPVVLFTTWALLVPS